MDRVPTLPRDSVGTAKPRKRKPRQDFSGLSAAQKEQAKRANNRQAAQNLRDRKRQHTEDMEEKLKTLEEETQHLQEELEEAEQENAETKDEIRKFAEELIERFSLRGAVDQLFNVMQTDDGSGVKVHQFLDSLAHLGGGNSPSSGSDSGFSPSSPHLVPGDSILSLPESPQTLAEQFPAAEALPCVAQAHAHAIPASDLLTPQWTSPSCSLLDSGSASLLPVLSPSISSAPTFSPCLSSSLPSSYSTTSLMESSSSSQLSSSPEDVLLQCQRDQNGLAAFTGCASQLQGLLCMLLIILFSQWLASDSPAALTLQPGTFWALVMALLSTLQSQRSPRSAASRPPLPLVRAVDPCPYLSPNSCRRAISWISQPSGPGPGTVCA